VKKIVAIIKPFKFGEVSDALHKAGVAGMTVTEVQGIGRQMGHAEIYSGAPYVAEFLPKVMIEFVLSDDLTERAIEVIRANGQTGHIGDGKIFVTLVEQVIRVRTGESGADAV